MAAAEPWGLSMPFRRTTGAQIAKARAAIVAIEAEIARSVADREEILLGSDAIDGVRKLDAAIDAKRGDVRRLTDRITALAVRQRAESLAARQRKKTEALASLKTALDVRHALAVELEAAAKRMGDAFARLVDERETIVADWPDALPSPRLDYLHRESVQKKLEGVIRTVGGPLWNGEFFKLGIADVVAEQNRIVLSLMESAPLQSGEDDLTDDEPTEAAA